jgi:hypothetical protein
MFGGMVPEVKHMRAAGNRLRALALLCATFFASACVNMDLTDYRPANESEAAILTRLIAYQAARNAFDVTAYLSCLHDQGAYHFASRVMVSKDQLRQRLPEFWQELIKGERHFFPMCRENLSGNYFRTMRLTNPNIRIDGKKATITVTFVVAGWRLKHYITMCQTQQGWLINGLDWETG